MTAKTKVKNYRGDNAYWEKEEPLTADTERIRLSYFPQAGKLQISQLWRDRNTAELRRGKGVTLDQEDMQLNPETLELLKTVLEEWA